MRSLMFLVLCAIATLAILGEDVAGKKLRLKRACHFLANGQRMCDVQKCSHPTVPTNSQIDCVIGRCTLKCLTGYKLSSGEEELTIYCNNDNQKWMTGKNQHLLELMLKCERMH